MRCWYPRSLGTAAWNDARQGCRTILSRLREECLNLEVF